MDRARKLRPSPAMTVALLALFVSLSGLAIAGTKGGQSQKLPPNSVGPKQLKTNAVTPPDIAAASILRDKLAKDSVNGDKIQNGTVVRDDLPDKVINSSKIAKLPGAAAEEANVTTVGGSGVQLSYDFEQFDYTGDMYFDSDPAKMRAPRDGLYMVTISVVWQAEAGMRKLFLVEEQQNPVCNCEFDSQTIPAAAASDTPQTMTSLVELAAGDKVWAGADSTGDDGSTDIITTRRPRLTMIWLGPAQ